MHTSSRLWMVALAAAGTFGMAGTASAADIIPAPVYIPPPVITTPPPTPFAGFYLGGHAGYGWATHKGCFGEEFPVDPACENQDEDDFLPFDYNQNGWLAGGQVGYNHFIGGSRVLLGAEVSASLTGITGNLIVEEDEESDFDDDLGGVGDWTYLATATARLGFTPTDNILLYAEGGLGLGGFRYNAIECNFESNLQGWVVGAGIEAKVSTNNTLFLEYNHFDFKGKDAACGGEDVAVYTNPDVDVFKVGFNHFFN